MTGYTLDWLSASLDGCNTLAASGHATSLTIATPAQNGSCWVPGALPDGSFGLVGRSVETPMIVTVDFDEAVENLSFELWDPHAFADGVPAKGWHGRITVKALDADGQQVPVIFKRLASHHAVHDHVLRLSDNAPDQTAAGAAADSVMVSIAGPIVALQIICDHDSGAQTGRTLGLGRVSFETCADASDVLNHDEIQAAAFMPRNHAPNPSHDLAQVVPCFTPGTMIATPRGEVAVETLKAGDRILTRDNGIQTIQWVGQKRLDFMELKQAPLLRPIRIAAGAMGDGMPERDMLVSPTHRMLIVSHHAELYFGQSEILVSAKHMLAMEGVSVSDQPYVTYIHMMCENHEIVLSDGAWSESFQPGDHTLKGFDADQREELFTLFPELATEEGLAAYRAARNTLNKREAALLFKG